MLVMSGKYRDIWSRDTHNKLDTAINSALTADVTAILRGEVVSERPEGDS